MEVQAQQQALRFVLEHHSDFLEVTDLTNALLACKDLARLRHNISYIHNIAQKCEDPLNPYSRALRSYFKKILKGRKDSYLTESERKAVEVWETKYVLSRNAIKNSSGKDGLQGWNKLKNGGDGWKVEDFHTNPPHKTCFSTSYGLCQMEYTVPIEKFLKSNINLQNLLEKAVIKAGCSIGRRWDCGASGKISFKVQDSGKKVLYFKEVEVKNEELIVTKDRESIYKRVEFIYDPSQEKEDRVAKYFTLTIEGRDGRSWAGWYGARFSDATISSYFRSIDDSLKPLKIEDTNDE